MKDGTIGSLLLADMIVVSFLFAIPAMTLILAGPALIALYQTIDQLYKERDVPIWQRYKQAFLSNLKRGLFLEGLGIAYVAVFAGLIYSLMMITPYFGVLAVILVKLGCAVSRRVRSLVQLVCPIIARNSKRNGVSRFLAVRQNAIIYWWSHSCLCIVQQSEPILICLFRDLRLSLCPSVVFQ